ncbi:MAG: radical SAM protein [Leptospirales bacterium]|nr:radical SAM protein [Leptospirales bacterium]
MNDSNLSSSDWALRSAADLQSYDPAQVFSAGEHCHHISNTAYPLSHNVTWLPYRVKREGHRDLVESAFDRIRNGGLTLYSHIPFCQTRCYFCEYTVVGRSELSATEEYMSLLSRELQMYGGLLGKRRLSGFDIGGGTPSFVDASLIEAHLSEVRRTFDVGAECLVSIETTPAIAAIEPAKIRAYRQMGIDRISMGIQVTEPDLLKRLNRDSNGVSEIYRAAEHIRDAGFRNFNLDVMYGFARQSLESLEHTLQVAVSPAPESITLYRMRYKLTRISDEADQVGLDFVRSHAALASRILKEAGYVSNPGKNTYTRRDQARLHSGTSAYLTRRVIQGMPYLGIGLGAQTFTDTSIAYNDGAASKSIAPYRKSVELSRLPIQDQYNLPLIQMAAKMTAVSFYFGEVNLASFSQKFGTTFENVYPNEVRYAISEGLMHYTESENGPELAGLNRHSLSLTEKGARHFNGTIALFFAPSVQRVLLENTVDLRRNRAAALSTAVA